MAKTAEFRLDESVSSLQDLKSLGLEIEAYAKWFNHAAVKRQAGVKSRKNAAAPALSDSASSVITSWSKGQPQTTKLLDELIAYLDEYAANAPQFTIILAAPPTATLKKTIVRWCRQNVSARMLINFQFNSTILGGMVVRVGSHIYDWSFRKEILANAAKFPEALRRV